MQIDQLKQLIESVHDAHVNKDEEKIFELSADVMSVYLEAMSDVHFGGLKTEWLNEMVEAIDNGDAAELMKIIEKEEDSEDRFLGSQVAALFAGFRQRDSMVTIAQSIGIKALLEIR